ncbi:hypothetical protein [Montanilutibacter psychrotolerans]|uniref:Uncharacterized protein n=1 Tax=Montanilutibacter psychrotolerans TaxID=1327343 RepID=A0A3M8SN36_9GAMM|nr:hypothetical protein [Lysobacter psychrotolerans]RNF82065.1 hypothetical protein EER27_15565 [Lysobacter psychrotolerans]
MRIAIAAIIGGIVMFIWGAVAHMALPIGEAGFRFPPQQEAVLDAIGQSATEPGVYMYPSMEMEKYGDEAAMKAFLEESRGKAYAFVVYQPDGNPATTSMAPNLGKQFVSVLLASAVLAWILSLGAWSFGRRVLVAGAAGLFSWLAISVPYWNWYMFPLTFTLGALAEQVIGWLLAGAAMAWWLGRKDAAGR